MHSILIESAAQHSLLSINKGPFPLIFQHLFYKENFIYQIKKNLKKIHLSIKDISFISIGTGPGSFTGIRKAASIAQALSYANNIPIVGFSSLKSFIPKKNGPFASVIDAKSKKFYILEAEKNEKKIFYHSVKLISQENLYTLKKRILSPHDLPIPYEKSLPDENHLADLSFEKFKNKDYSLKEIKLYIDLKSIGL